MAKARIEFVRLRSKDSAGLQNALDYGNVAPVTKTISGTALTGAGRVTAPANVSGYTAFHARITADTDCVVTLAPAGDAGTSYDATLTEEGGFVVLANQPVFMPVTPGQLISIITGPWA